MESKHTRGEAKIDYDNNEHGCWYSIETEDDTIAKVEYRYNIVSDYAEVVEANAQLIADAFNVTNETNMTPRELQKSHAELLYALKLLVSDVDSYHTKEPMTWTQRKEKEFATSQYLHHCKQAIKNATK